MSDTANIMLLLMAKDGIKTSKIEELLPGSQYYIGWPSRQGWIAQDKEKNLVLTEKGKERLEYYRQRKAWAFEEATKKLKKALRKSAKLDKLLLEGMSKDMSKLIKKVSKYKGDKRFLAEMGMALGIFEQRIGRIQDNLEEPEEPESESERAWEKYEEKQEIFDEMSGLLEIVLEHLREVIGAIEEME